MNLCLCMSLTDTNRIHIPILFLHNTSLLLVYITKYFSFGARVHKEPPANIEYLLEVPYLSVIIFQSISCSNFLNNPHWKKSSNEISSPSHIILMVTIPVFLLLPFMIFLRVDGGMPASYANCDILIFFSLHKFLILNTTASCTFNDFHPNTYFVKIMIIFHIVPFYEI